jgi:hypothetical protein
MRITLLLLLVAFQICSLSVNGQEPEQPKSKWTIGVGLDQAMVLIPPSIFWGDKFVIGWSPQLELRKQKVGILLATEIGNSFHELSFGLLGGSAAIRYYPKNKYLFFQLLGAKTKLNYFEEQNAMPNSSGLNVPWANEHQFVNKRIVLGLGLEKKLGPITGSIFSGLYMAQLQYNYWNIKKTEYLSAYAIRELGVQINIGLIYEF